MAKETDEKNTNLSFKGPLPLFILLYALILLLIEVL